MVTVETCIAANPLMHILLLGLKVGPTAFVWDVPVVQHVLHGFILLRSSGAPLEHFRVCRHHDLAK